MAVPGRTGLMAVNLDGRELGLRYETAWLMAHKLRHALTERPEFPLEGLVEVDESRSLPVRRRDTGACQDTRRSK